MAFNENDRVRVSNQSRDERNQLGSVLRLGAGSGRNQQVFVRIDGHAAGAETMFLDGDLKASTLDSPILY